MNDSRSPKSPKTPRGSSKGGGRRSAVDSKSSKDEIAQPTQDPTGGETEAGNLLATYSKTINYAEKALEKAIEGGFDPSLRKPRHTRQSTFLQPPKKYTSRSTRNNTMSSFVPKRASMLQFSEKLDDVPDSSVGMIHNVNSILKERQQLNEERKELEDRLGEIRSKMSQTQEEKDKRRHEQFEELEREIDSITGGPITNPSLSQSTSVTQFDGYKFGTDDETFEEVFDRAMQMRDESEDKMLGYKDRQNLLEQEKEWLAFEPETLVWRKLKERIYNRKEGKMNPSDEIRLSDDQVSNYIRAGEETDIIREKEASVVRKERIAKVIRNEIVDEVIEMIATNTARYLWNVAQTLVKEVKSILINVLLENDEDNGKKGKPSPQETGEIQLLMGHFDEERKRQHKIFVEKYGEEWANNGFAPKALSVSESRLVYRDPTGELEPGRPKLIARQTTDQKISLMESLSALSQDIDQKPLLALEKHFWEGVQLNQLKQGGLKPPLGIKNVVCCRVFPIPLQRRSDLAVGYKNGRFTITSIPWSSKYSAVTTAVSRSISSYRDRCAVVEMKQGRGNMFITMDINGSIRVYSLTSGESEGGSSKFFVSPLEDFSPISPICVSIYKADHFRFPIPEVFRPLSNPKTVKDFDGGPHEQRLKKLYEDVYSEKAANFRGTPTCVCFHPSMTASGRQVSIIAGLRGGRMVKMNVDSDVPALAAPIVYPQETPFVKYEYCNPKVSHPDYLLASGDSTKAGNYVSRELFHYHQSQILFVDTVRCVSDTIISMDASGILALWKYSPDQFNGYYRFAPTTTTKVDMNWLMFEIIDEGNKRNIVDAPSNELQSRLMHSNYVSNRGVSVETFQPVTSFKEDGSDDNLIVYKRTRIPRKLIERDKDDEIVALDTLQAGLSMLGTDTTGHRKGQDILFDGKALVSEKVGNIQGSDMDTLHTIEEGEKEGQDNVKPDAATALLTTAAKVLRKSQNLDSDGADLSQSSSMTSMHSTMSGKHLVGGSILPSVLKAAPSLSSSSSMRSEASASLSEAQSTSSIHEGTEENVIDIWEAQQVRRLPKDAIFFGAKMSPDGLIVVILVLFSKRKTHATSREDADTGAFVTIDATTMQFKAPYPMFELSKSDTILDFHVGPISKETLTRNVFVCSAVGGLRAFSLTTGEEIVNSCFPFQAKHPSKDNIKSDFRYGLFSICQSQRIMICKGEKESKSLLVFRFEDTGIRGDNVSIQEERVAAYNCYSEEEREMVKAYAVATTERVIMDESDEARKLSEELYEAYIQRMANTETFIKELLDDILTYMDHLIDEREEIDRMNKDRSKLLKDVYGLERYGVVQPTEWPPASVDSVLGKKHYEEIQMAIDKVSGNSVDGNSNLNSRSNTTFEGMKIEKSREKLLTGHDTNGKRDKNENDDM